MMVGELKLDRETVTKILTEDLGMRKVSGKMVPRILSDDQKQRRLDVFLISLVSWQKETTFWIELLRVMNHGAFSTIRKRNAKACNEKHQHHRDQKKARMSGAQVKTMLIFFYHKGIVHFEFLEQGGTVTQQCYLEILARLREDFCRRRPDLWPDTWILHHDNVPAHGALAVREFWTKRNDIEIGPSTIFARFGSVRLLAIPKTEDSFEGTQIFRHCRHSGTCDDHPADDSRTGVPEMF
jgi:hypothetical protein